MSNGYQIALERYNQALQNFDYADAEYIDVAVHEINAAEKLVNIEIKKIAALTQQTN